MSLGRQRPRLYRHKVDWILPFVANRRVLDLGCIDHDLVTTDSPAWLHGRIAERAASVVGVDYLEDACAVLRSRGFDIRCENVETMDLGEVFDVIVAGDLIEHLNNFGLFLERIAAHLTDEGIALITTPNPLNILRVFNVLVRGNVSANPEHTCWFTEGVLQQLLTRHHLEVTDVAYVDDSHRYYGRKWIPFMPVNWMLCRVRPRFAETVCLAVRRFPGAHGSRPSATSP